MNRSLIDRLFPLLFDAADAGGGGGLGEVDDLNADLAVLNDDKPDDKSGDEADDDDEDKQVENDLQILDAEDDDEDEDKEKDDGDEDEDDDQQDDKDGDKEDKSDDDKEKPEVIEGRPSIKQIKEVAPDLFKKIPALKDIYFRESKFSQIFSDPEEAEEAATYAGHYIRLEKSIGQQGDPGVLLKELKENNPDAFKSVVAKFLPEVKKNDPDTYVAATLPILEDLVYHAFQHASKTGDKNLAASARHIANFVFGSGDIPDITKREGASKHPAEQKLEEERRNWETSRFREADQEINQRIGRTLEASIAQGLDPDNVLSERIRKAIIRDTIEELNATLLKDQLHKRKMTQLWEKGRTDSYSKQTKDAIVNSFLGSAKPLLRSIRNRIRDEALGKSASRTDDSGKNNNNKDKARTGKRSFVGSNRPGSKRAPGSVLDPSKIDYRRTSDMDILMDEGGDKIKLKGQR